jgi:hypothetical protein
MVFLTSIESARPSALLRAWVLLLLAPCTWAAALGILFSLTDETCVSGSRSAMWLVAVSCVVLTAVPAVVAWRLKRAIHSSSDAAERARFMMGVAVGGSLLFALVTLISAVPIGLLDPCRT